MTNIINCRLIFVILYLISVILSAQTRDKKVFTHYLPWYDTGELRRGWCNDGDCTTPDSIHYTNIPLIGEYSQLDPDVIEYHLLLAHAAHLDGFILNTETFSDFQRNICRVFLNKMAALRNSFPSFTMQVIISYDNKYDIDSIDIFNNFVYMRDSLILNPDYTDFYFRDDITGKLIIIAWSDNSVPTYYNTLKQVFGEDQFIFITRNARMFDYSDANFEWTGYTTSDTTDSTNWGKQYFLDFEWIMSRQSEFGLQNPENKNLLMMGAVYPGFDDRNVPAYWNNGTLNYIARDVVEGETMALTWDWQISYIPNRFGGDIAVENPWIQICTWNDWPEGTSVEPASMETYGYRALRTTSNKIAEFKELQLSEDDSLGILIPVEIYSFRERDCMEEANIALDLFIQGLYSDALDTLEILCDTGELIKNELPDEFVLFQNYPNPFNPATTIEYKIGSPGDVKIILFDVLGREFQILVDEYKHTGSYKKIFNAGSLPSGIYYYQMISGHYTQTKSMVLLK